MSKFLWEVPSPDKPVKIDVRGYDLIRDPLLNKGAAFPEDERLAFGLDGLLPTRVNTMDEQAARFCQFLSRLSVPMNKYVELAELHDRNENLFYRVLMDDLQNLMPIVYTPTVGEATREFSHVFRLGQDNFRWVGGSDYSGIWLREQAQKLGLQAWVPELAATAGSLNADLQLAGSLHRPQVIGELALTDGAGNVATADGPALGLDTAEPPPPPAYDAEANQSDPPAGVVAGAARSATMTSGRSSSCTVTARPLPSCANASSEHAPASSGSCWT